MQSHHKRNETKRHTKPRFTSIHNHTLQKTAGKTNTNEITSGRANFFLRGAIISTERNLAGGVPSIGKRKGGFPFMSLSRDWGGRCKFNLFHSWLPLMMPPVEGFFFLGGDWPPQTARLRVGFLFIREVSRGPRFLRERWK